MKKVKTFETFLNERIAETIAKFDIGQRVKYKNHGNGYYAIVNVTPKGYNVEGAWPGGETQKYFDVPEYDLEL